MSEIESTDQNDSCVFMISARTAPPRKTMCFLRGGSSIRILNFYHHHESESAIYLTCIAMSAERRRTYAQSLRISLEYFTQM